jgi:hypothetical protein
MTTLVFAILTCFSGSGLCLDYNRMVRFHSANDCMIFLQNNVAHGRTLIDGRAYADTRHTVWSECDQRPASSWSPVN